MRLGDNRVAVFGRQLRADLGEPLLECSNDELKVPFAKVDAKVLREPLFARVAWDRRARPGPKTAGDLGVTPVAVPSLCGAGRSELPRYHGNPTAEKRGFR